MSTDADFDPFADEKTEEKVLTEETTETGDGLTVTFKAHGGYDAPWVVVKGSANYVAGLLGVKEFDGRLSTLMKQAAKVDSFYKKEVGGGSGKG